MLYSKQFIKSPAAEWVVFIHGAGGSSSIWFKQLREFRQHFNVLLIDLRGHGKSKNLLQEHLRKTYTFTDVTKDVLEVLDDRRIKAAHFIGISLGCLIIRTLGELQPERIKSMILGGAITRLTIRSKVLMHAGNVLKRVMPYMWLYKLLAWIIMPKKRHEQSRLLFIEEAKRLARKEFLRWTRLTGEINPLLRYFHEKEIFIPTLYLMGEEDYMFLAPVRAIVKQHQSAILEVVSNSGHVVNVDQPDIFNQLSIQFIQKHS
ncbi:alpha/beta hydrolase [Cytophagaceae bacterium YF14B1]|uniref:Alpha/beta hydrolase n=1 Tax=Xanthocytophaga flava TaxID=3048013 RepID=A0AAE3U752_9BACT|nr:alpha/beta hydrolase [Xanthocytophaga flavus]MDJ1479314.1 alpha/beta hydrolase [Xanthocytophaga flavus]